MMNSLWRSTASCDCQVRDLLPSNHCVVTAAAATAAVVWREAIEVPATHSARRPPY
jgi:hypothetical protein